MRYARIAIVAAAVLALLGGCASLAGRVGIASQDYVDEQISAAQAGLREDIDENRQDVEAVQGELDSYAEMAAELEQLIVSIQATVETTDELSRLAEVLQGRLENLPVETIRQLVDILQQYLEGT